MSSGKRRRDSGGGGLAKWGIGIGVLVALLLAANLSWGVLPMFTEDKPDPEGFLPDQFFLAAAYWIPVGAGMGLCLLGAFWASRAYAEKESRTLLWFRRSLLAGFAGLVAYAGATFEPEMFDRDHLAAVAGWVMLLIILPTAMGAWRSYRAPSHGGRGGGKKKRKRKPHPSMTHTLDDLPTDPEARAGAEVDA